MMHGTGPSFNNAAIYLALPYISGLSEVFLQLNDDYFVTRPLSRAFFFYREQLSVLKKGGRRSRPGLRAGWHEV